MSWITNFLGSTIGQKLIMSLTGLFLIIFLVVHLVGNLQLMAGDGGEQFNVYAKFMTTNPLIKTISYLLYAFILIHAFQGIIIWRNNRKARGNERYAVPVKKGNSFASRNMASLGIVILVFILIHMWQFWFQMKIGALEMITVDGTQVKDLYTPVAAAFSEWYFVAFYVISMIFIAFHLHHGFQSAFQSLGLNHKKYTPAIRWLGSLYAIIIPLGFAIIPVYFYLFIR